MKTRSFRFCGTSGSKAVPARWARRCLLGGAVALGMMTCQAGAALTAYRNAVLADGATGYWEFEETTGSVANDSASGGGSNNGTFVGGTVLNQTGGPVGLGRSVSFNGADARVRIPDNAIFDLGTGN